jgi:DNA primase
MSAIEEIKQKLDIVSLIGQYTKLTKSGRTFRGLCPFHSEKTPSFFVYPEQGSWHCFGACNTGGDAFSFLMKKENIDFGEALRILAERTGTALPERAEPGVNKDEKERVYRINEEAAEYFHDLLLKSPAAEKARGYLARRSVSAESISRFKLGYSPAAWTNLEKHLTEIGYPKEELAAAGLVIESESKETHDRFRNRLVFPIWDARGRVTGFGARALDDSMPKYLNSPQTVVFDKSGSLYGINLAAPTIRKEDSVVLVEGYMDTLIAHQYGFTGVVGSLGTAITEKQIANLKRLTKNLILALDADEAGEEAMLRCVGYENSLESEIRVVLLPQGKDPDEVIIASPDEWRRFVAEAPPIMDYTLKLVTEALDLATARGKTQAVDRLLPIVAAIKSPVRQGHYLGELARLVGTSEARLEAELAGRKSVAHRVKESKPEAAVPVRLLASPIEDYTLALLLAYPSLKSEETQPLPEYFASSENREILVRWQESPDLDTLRERLAPALWEHLDYLRSYLKQKGTPANRVEKRYADCVLNLRKQYLRNLEANRAEVFALEAEVGGTGADLVKLKEAGIEPSTELLRTFRQAGKRTKE